MRFLLMVLAGAAMLLTTLFGLGALAIGSAQPGSPVAAGAVGEAVAPVLPSGGDPDTAVARVLTWAYQQRGKPYQWGAEGPDVYDCSGFTLRAYQQAGVQLPRVSRQQYAATRHRSVPTSQLAPGDLLFWAYDTRDPTSIHHVAIYVGGGRMIDAPHTGATIQVRAVYWSGFLGATRPIG